MAKKLCELCHKQPATVPDRARMGRMVNRVCSACHSARLAGDMRVILEHRARPCGAICAGKVRDGRECSLGRCAVRETPHDRVQRGDPVPRGDSA